MAQFSLQYFNLFPNTFISVALRYKDNNIISSQKNVPSTFLANGTFKKSFCSPIIPYTQPFCRRVAWHQDFRPCSRGLR